ncbi:hypothetical protein B0H14DRAFT_3788165 [Mycena olivaceomarginata]|nr:hypothetical protein B0H14DRAFT_3788165 [Mycena olivaceomarginata]
MGGRWVAAELQMSFGQPKIIHARYNFGTPGIVAATCCFGPSEAIADSIVIGITAGACAPETITVRALLEVDHGGQKPRESAVYWALPKVWTQRFQSLGPDLPKAEFKRLQTDRDNFIKRKKERDDLPAARATYAELKSYLCINMVHSYIIQGASSFYLGLELELQVLSTTKAQDYCGILLARDSGQLQTRCYVLSLGRSSSLPFAWKDSSPRYLQTPVELDTTVTAKLGAEEAFHQRVPLVNLPVNERSKENVCPVFGLPSSVIIGMSLFLLLPRASDLRFGIGGGLLLNAAQNTIRSPSAHRACPVKAPEDESPGDATSFSSNSAAPLAATIRIHGTIECQENYPPEGTGIARIGLE